MNRAERLVSNPLPTPNEIIGAILSRVSSPKQKWMPVERIIQPNGIITSTDDVELLGFRTCVVFTGEGSFTITLRQVYDSKEEVTQEHQEPRLAVEIRRHADDDTGIVLPIPPLPGPEEPEREDGQNTTKAHELFNRLTEEVYTPHLKRTQRSLAKLGAAFTEAIQKG